MSFSTTTRHTGHMGTGGLGYETGFVKFNANDATVEFQTRLKNIRGVAFSILGTPATGEVLSLDEAINDFGDILVAQDGNITIRRAATTTSGLVVGITLFGI